MKPFILAALLLSLPAFARLGEDVSQMATRYGKPLQQDPKEGRYVFHKAAIRVTAQTIEGRCESIMYNQPAIPLHAFEVGALLSANSGGADWGEAIETRDGSVWRRKDGGAKAYLSAKKDSLVFDSAKWDASLEADRKAAIQRKREEMKGF